jgi:adenylate cyclase
MAADEFTEQVRAVLTGESPWLTKQRRAFKQIPSPPRAADIGEQQGDRDLYARQLALAKVGYASRAESRIAGGLPEPRVPEDEATQPGEGRGAQLAATAMGERMRPADFHTFLDRFYRLASDSIVAHDGIVDKVVGDEVIGLFFGGITGPRHAAAAVAAAIDLAERAVQASATPAMAIPLGTAVHTGEAFVGATGLGTTVEDFTALGDAVNITARLASAAAAGEVIVSVATAAAAGMTTDQLERRTVAIRGRTEPIEVIVLPGPDRNVSPDEHHA